MTHLTGHQLRVLFACGREPSYIRNQMLQRALALRHHVTTVTEPVQPALWRYTRTLGKAAWHLRQRPDVVLVGFYGQPLMPIIRGLTRCPILFDAYVSTYDTLCYDRCWFRPRSLPGWLSYALDLWSCRWADHVLLDTEAHRDYFVSTFQLPPEKIDVVYVGCDETHFTPRPSSRPTRAFEVFTYTSFLRLHGVEHILHAAKLLEPYGDISFSVAGGGPGLAAMQSLARELGLKNLHFPGWVPFDQLPDRIAKADLCLGGHFSAVPKASRVIATKTFQFLAMGKPTIVGHNGANREVLTHGQDSYFCRMADAAALSSAILELYQDPPLRRRLGEAGLALFRQRFSAQAVSQELQVILDRLIDRFPPCSKVHT